jgi:hypothetical protein
LTAVRRRSKPSTIGIAILAAGLLLFAEELFANGVFGGRLIWTYQNTKAQNLDEEAFVQNYFVTLRDRLFENTDMKLAFYLDTSKNFTRDLTLLRYRGELHLNHRFYTFDARYAPKQETTALESNISTEVTDQRYNVIVHIPKAPVLRAQYSQRSRYFQGVFDGRVRDMRGDLSYRWKVFDMGVNRWNTKSTNSADASTSVSGARFRYTQSFGPMFNAQAGWEGQLTERSRTLSLDDRKTTNHTFNALMSSAYENILWGSMSWISRRLTSDAANAVEDVENINDTGSFQLKFLPTSPFRLEFDRNYLSTQQNGNRNLSDFATIQAILTGPRRARWQGLAQMAQRFIIEREGNGVIPSNLYYVSLRGNVYPGIDARAEVSVSQQLKEIATVNQRYQSTSLLELYLKPRLSWLIAVNARVIKFSDRLYFLQNDRFNYGLTANYFARQYFNAGIDVRHNILTTGTRREDTSVVLNANFSMRSRSSLLFSYGINEIDYKNDETGGALNVDVTSNNLNFQMQVWITQSGSVSLVYTDVNRSDGNDTSFLTLNYRQDF